MDSSAFIALGESWFYNLPLAEQVSLAASTSFEFFPASTVAAPAVLAGEEELLESAHMDTEFGEDRLQVTPAKSSSKKKSTRGRSRSPTVSKSTPMPPGTKARRNPDRAVYATLLELQSVPVGFGPSYLSGPLSGQTDIRFD